MCTTMSTLQKTFLELITASTLAEYVIKEQKFIQKEFINIWEAEGGGSPVNLGYPVLQSKTISQTTNKKIRKVGGWIDG